MPNGARALEKLDHGGYDLVLTDIRMPELDGSGLYRAMQRHHPALAHRIVFMTGDSLSDETREFLGNLNAPLIHKPFDFSEVQRVVQDALVRS